MLGDAVYVSHAQCVYMCAIILLLSIIWELLKEDRSGWKARPAGLQGTLREMCWAFSQRGVCSHSQADLHYNS